MSQSPAAPRMPEVPLIRIPFSAQAEASLRALCNWMQIAAVISIVSGIVKAINAFTPHQDLGKLVDAAVTVLLGFLVYRAGTAFRQVATTDTADQGHLMEGFRLLRRVFLLQAILVIITLTLLVVGFFFVFVMLLSGKPVG
jgi:hypothetical protein